jgi:putative NADPH-quinone reductase
MDVPYLLGQSEFEQGQPPAEIRALQQDIERAEHIVLLFPLWLGGVPAKLKALLEQVFRGGFGFAIGERGWISKLKGRSARLVVTMGMPGPVFRLVFGAHGVKAIEKGILMLAGVRPIRSSIIGGVESIGPAGRARWLARMRALGAKAA